jgi:Ca2+-binding EF-hand superfamily protein
MKTRFVLASVALALTASFSLPALAQEIKREEMVTFFQPAMIDANKDGMVSKKEFMEAMGKTWDMHMAEAKKADPMMPRDKMTLQQFLEFSKMFGLDHGA